MKRQKNKMRIGIVFLFTIVFMLNGINYANAATEKPGDIKGVKVSVTANKITISWDKAARAKGYEIAYAWTTKTGKSATKITYTSKTKISITNLDLKKLKSTIKITIKAYNFKGKKKQYGKAKTVILKASSKNVYVPIHK